MKNITESRRQRLYSTVCVHFNTVKKGRVITRSNREVLTFLRKLHKFESVSRKRRILVK